MMISVNGPYVQGKIAWNGLPKMSIMGNVLKISKGMDSMSVYGVAPKGLLTNGSKTSDTLEYHAAFMNLNATNFNGQVLRLMPKSLSSIGIWKGAKVPCF